MNPYSVLGVDQNADEREIKKAYHKLVKENHPDRFLDENEKKKATERLAKINEAYNMIEKNQSYKGYGSSQSSYGGSGEALQKVREFIRTNDILAAQSLLNAISNKNAEWHYLQGVVYMRQGFYDSAKRHFEAAVEMDPVNNEYRTAYNNLSDSAAGFYGSNPYINIRSFNRGTCCLTTLCATSCASMCCSNCLWGLGGLFRC